MGTYGYISMIAMLCYGFMLLMFLTAKRNKLVNSFLIVLTGLILWTGGSVCMRAEMWPNYIVWYHVSLLGILLLPYAYYCFILSFGGKRKKLPGQIYLIAMMGCFVLNVFTNAILKYPKMITRDGVTSFVYDVTWAVSIFFCVAGIFLVYLFRELVGICKENPHMRRQYEPIVLGIVILFVGNMVLGLPVFEGFPIDLFSGLLNAFFLFYALMRRHLFRLEMLASSSICYGVGLLFSVVFFLDVVPYFQDDLQRVLGGETTVYSLSLALIFLATYGIVTCLWKLLVKNVFVKEELQNAEKMKEYSSAVSKTLELQKIMEQTIHVIKETMEVGDVYICLQEQKGRPYKGVYCDKPLNDLTFSFEEENPLVQWIKSNEEPLIYREFRYTVAYKSMWESEKQQLDRMGIRLCVGLKDETSLNGIILIAAPHTRKAIGYAELQQLSSISSVASIAMKNARMYEQAYIEARTDEMTGLLNRKYFYEVLSREFESDEETAVALAILNVDDFKLYNQLYGIKEGDRCLKRIADIIRNSVGDAGYTARYSGKEFAILLPKYDIYSAKKMVESITKQIYEMNNTGSDVKLKAVTVSAGISATPYAVKTMKELMDAVDLAVYHVKHGGKNGIQVFDTIFQNANARESVSERTNIYQEYESTIFALTAAIDVKDHYTFSHSNNVAYYATTLAEHVGLNAGIVEIIRQAALLHDVGKIGIPESILNKPGKLTDEEYEVIKGHVEASIDIIRHLPSLDYVIPAVIGHHERYDGRGYPRRIAGEDIPMTARILCIADSFDAMTSKRCYKDAFSVEEAKKRLLEGAGTQFDPHLVWDFVACLDSGKIKLVDTEYSKK